MAVKAREVRERLKTARNNNLWMEEVQYCLESIAEEIGVIQQTIINLAESNDKMTDILLSMSQVAAGMDKKLKEVVTKSLGKDEPVIR